jgi:hypothetical protein
MLAAGPVQPTWDPKKFSRCRWCTKFRAHSEQGCECYQPLPETSGQEGLWNEAHIETRRHGLTRSVLQSASVRPKKVPNGIDQGMPRRCFSTASVNKEDTRSTSYKTLVGEPKDSEQVTKQPHGRSSSQKKLITARLCRNPKKYISRHYYYRARFSPDHREHSG